MKLFKLLPYLNRQNTVPVINSACYTTDDFLILSTSVGQFTFDPVDCDFAGVDDDVILFLFARKNENNRVVYCSMRVIDEKPKMFKITKYPPRMV